MALAMGTASVASLIEAQVAVREDATAVVGVDGPALTYAQLDRHVRAIGDGLRAAGVRRADRVAIVAPNGPAMAVAFLGVASAAACAPLNPGYTAPELEFYLSDLAARAVIVPAGSETPARDVARARGIAVLELAGMALDAPGRPADDTDEPAGPRDIALVLHTSGTTSRPKIIPLSHGNLCASARSIGATLGLTAEDCCLNVMPLFHIHGLIGALLSSLAAGGSVVCTPGFSPVQFYAWLDQFGPSWYTAVPTMHQEVLARADAHRDTIARRPLRFIRSASAALAPEVMAGLERAFDAPVIEAYGMTEASHQIASNPLPPARRKPGSVGLPAGCDVAILDAAGRPLAPGESGEIAISGPGVTRARPAGTDDERWLRTGDLGSIDGDGYVFIAGRLKEIINRAGEKISPREVDEALLRHPGVAQAVTCAVADARLGEDVVAVVVRRPGATVTERELRDFASTHVAAFKVPRRVKFVDAIPKGPTGKIQRIGLAEKLGLDAACLAQPSGPVGYEAPTTATETTLVEIVREVLKLDRVGIHDNFFELGGDSLASMEVVAAVDARLGVTVGVRELAFGTLQQVAAACDEGGASQTTDAATKGGFLKALTRWRRRS